MISGSMEPQIPVGSIVYVRAVDFQNLSQGDIIAFEAGASVVTHRIVSINTEERLLTTKGDANSAEDFRPVSYANVIGRVEMHLPVLGNVAAALSETQGKIAAFIVLLVGILISQLGDKKGDKSGKEDEASGSKKSLGINPKVILVLGLVIIIGSLGGFLYIYMGYQKSENLYDSLQQSFTVNLVKDSVTAESEIAWQDMIDVDFEALKLVNPDVVGWIYVEGTDISYPILYSGDDSTYLRTTIDKEPATAGSIFLEGYNLPDFSDSHSIIYGHNMRNLSMFGTLKYYKEDGYLEEHRHFQIITPEGKGRFEIFSYFDTEPASWVYTVPYYDNSEFQDYIDRLISSSYKKTDDQVKSSDKIVTLSTCSSSGMRFTVHGYLTDFAEN